MRMVTFHLILVGVFVFVALIAYGIGHTLGEAKGEMRIMRKLEKALIDSGYKIPGILSDDKGGERDEC